MLRYLIQFAQDAYVAQQRGGPPPHIGKGIGLVIGITFMQFCQSLGTNQFIYFGMMVGGQARATLIAVLFEKAMNISGRAKAGGTEIKEGPETESEHLEKVKHEKKAAKDAKKNAKNGISPTDAIKGVAGDGTGWGNGRVVNLMSVDTYRVDQASGMFHMVWTAPIALLVTLVLLVINLTYSALAGFSLLVAGMPLLTMAVKSLFARRKDINKVTDQRVTLTQEILQAVRFVKFFGWESSFLARVEAIRDREIHMIQVLLAIRNVINAIAMTLPIFASVLAFITYSSTNHNMNPAEVFSSLALFNSLRMPLNLLPLVIGQVIDAWSSVQRIQEYLLSEEQGEDAKFDEAAENAVVMENADFTWERTASQDPNRAQMPEKKQTKAEIKIDKDLKKQALKDKKTAQETSTNDQETSDATADDGSTLIEDREPFKLQGMNFTIGRNELVAIIGGVASGKSSLLASLAGDMRKTKGEVVMGASRAFCPQYAWIQNATVRDNIIFGKEMDKQWLVFTIRNSRDIC